MNHSDFDAIIAAALSEDIGTGDITSELLIPPHVQAEMIFVAKELLMACGIFIPARVYTCLEASITVEHYCEEGQRVFENEKMLKITGPAKTLLTGERVALNLMQRMSGIATLTRSYVNAVAGTKAIILDTRKTMPNLRVVDKYSVVVGGGQNHRMGLYDMVMIKDNHVVVGMRHGAWGIRELVSKARLEYSSLIPNPQSSILNPQSPMPIIVECDTLEQVKEAVQATPDRILLDNMDNDTLRRAVELVNGKVPLEASGNVSLETVQGIAQTGVDYISVGKLTHSVSAADISADIVLL